MRRDLFQVREGRARSLRRDDETVGGDCPLVDHHAVSLTRVRTILLVEASACPGNLLRPILRFVFHFYHAPMPRQYWPYCLN